MTQRPPTIYAACAAAAVCLCLAGCGGELTSNESTLNPAGPQARAIGGLTATFIVVCGVVFVAIMVTLVAAFVRVRRRPADEESASIDVRGSAVAFTMPPVSEPEPAHERRVWRVVWVAVGVTVVTLVALLFGDFFVGRTLEAAARTTATPLKIKVIAHQWWWEVHYEDWPERFGERVPSFAVTTANEIHIPVDNRDPVTVDFRLESHDVIHSFWVPNLHGKRDVIPGHGTDLYVQADRVGQFWGECAEFCGYQHAQMRLLVVAEPPEQFQKWLDGQRMVAPEPVNVLQTAGRLVFQRASCAMCHAIQGTGAGGLVGPDLTHVASRQLLAAGAISNSPGNLAGWIVDPQRIKPGTRMPANPLSPADLRVLLEYLQALK